MESQFRQPKQVINTEGNKQSIARNFGIGDNEVCYAKPGQPLTGYKAIYDKATQRAYYLPTGLTGTVTSMSIAGVLTHSAGTVDLSALAVTREEYVTLPGTFTVGGMVNTKNELLIHTNGKYRWDGILPVNVLPNSTPEAAGGIGPGKWIIEGMGSISPKPVTWTGFAGGADPTGISSSTAAFQASLDQLGYVFMPANTTFLIDGSLNLAKSAVIFGAGRSLTKLKFSGNSATPFVKAILGYSSTDLVCLRDFTAIATVPNCGPLASVKTDAAAQSASQVVVGDLDKLIVNNVDAYGDSSGNYWNCGFEAIDCGGVHIHNFTLNNRTVSAQNDITTSGFRFRTTAQKVSVIRALTAQDFYLLRMYYGIDTKPFNNLGGGITSYYLSDFEIVGVRNGIRAQNWCATWRVTGHFDSTEQCLNFQGAGITNARFPGCDFRKGNNGGSGYVVGPMITLDYGEQITFNGSTFSGINLNLADPSNVAFSFTNAYNGNYAFLVTIDGNTFTKFHNVLGQTNGADIITIGNNSYNQIADAITFDSNLDSSFSLQTPIPSISQVVSLPVGDSTFTVNVTANRFKNAPNYADARPVNNPTQTIRVVYDYGGSTASALLFRVYGVTTAANFRFGITTA